MSDPTRDPSFKTAMTGLALVAPTIYFMTAAALEHEVGIRFLYAPIEPLLANPASPILILGGPLLAFLLNLLQVVRLSAHADPGGVAATVTILRKPWNLVSAGLILLVLLALSAYVVAENWRCWVGLLPRC